MSNFIKWTVVVLAVFSNEVVLAQEKGRLEFKVSDYDFGEIKEEDGPAIYEFEFENIGTAPLIISRVKASCGCTTPDWSREPVLPGEKGFVKAQYNPANRPGTFRKSLTITTNGNPPTAYAYIRGKVLPRVRSLEEQMKIKIGKTRFRNRSVNMGRLTTEKIIDKSFDIYNDSPDTVTLSKDYEAPDFIKLTFDRQKLAPKEIGKVIIWYDPVHEDNLGYNNHGIQIFTDEENAGIKKLNVLATISEYFPPMSPEERAEAPRLAIKDRLQDLGQIRHGEKAVAEFELTNHGRSNLNIRKLKSNCACFVAEIPNYDIKPGQSIIMKGTFNSTGKRGNQNKSITIYTNDPIDPTQMVSVKASILPAN